MIILLAYIGGSALAIWLIYLLLVRLGQSQPVEVHTIQQIADILQREGISLNVKKSVIEPGGRQAFVLLENDKIYLLRAMGHFWQIKDLPVTLRAEKSDATLKLILSSPTDDDAQFRFEREQDADFWQAVIMQKSHQHSQTETAHV